MAMIVQEFRLSWRGLLRRENHGFTFATVATLALAMAAVTTIASLAYGVLWAPLPYATPERLVHIDEANAARGVSAYAASYPNFLSWRDQSAAFSGMAAVREGSANLGGEAGFAAERLIAHSVTPNLWSLLGAPLLLGGGLSDQANAVKQVVISERLWRQRFQSSQRIIGHTLRVDAEVYEIVGISPQDMGFTRDVDLWLPIVADEAMSNRGDRRLVVLARLRDGVSSIAAQAELSAIADGLAKQFPDSNRGWSLHVNSVRDWIVGADARQRLLLLLAAVGLLMLVAFTNVANLQIARAAARLHEVSVRQALGASRQRVMMMLTIENLSLVAAGAVIGVFISYLLLHTVHGVLPTSIPRQAAIGFSFWVAALSSVLASLAAMLFGATATWIARGAQPHQALGKSNRATLGTHATPLRDALVIVQFALATTLVLVSALLVQQYLALRGAEPGFKSAGVVTARVTLPAPSSDEEHARSLAHFGNLLEGVRALPGVQAAGLSSEIPMGELNTGMEVWGPNTIADSTDPGVQASWRIVTADYLDTLSISLLRGRSFAEHDEPAQSALISAGLAARLFAAESDPIGQQIYLENGQRRTIVGVVGDVRQVGLGQSYTPTMYFPTTWYLWPTMTLAVRTEGEPALLINAMREVARRTSPDHPLFDMRTLTSVLDASVAQQKLQMWVITIFAISSLLLAALGIAGVMNYLLVRRAPELALRMALGASHVATTRRELIRGTGVCAVGIVIGIALALWVRQLLLQTTEPAGTMGLNIVAVALTLLLVGTLASWWPLRRIAKISPAQLLRGD
jgi:putative ABC transport system permease protein